MEAINTANTANTAKQSNEMGEGFELKKISVWSIRHCILYRILLHWAKRGVAVWIWHYENERPSPQLYWKFGTHALSEIEKEVETAKTNWKSA